MDLRAELARFDPTLPVERAVMPPSSWYTDPSMYALERRVIFQKNWHPAARLDELRSPGDYVSGCLAGMPWVVVRGQDRVLRAFHNVCRHKAAVVAEGAGALDVLTCPYHGWAYGLDGRLQSAPRIAGIEDFDREALSLPPMQVTEWGLWVWINPDLSAAPLIDQLPELTGMMAGRWDGLHFVGRRSYLIECNWKVFIDNYLDGGYHVPNMHPSLDAQIDMGTYRTACFGRSSVQLAGEGEGHQNLEVDPSIRIGDGAIYGWVYPHFTLNRYGPVLDINLTLPRGVNQTEVIIDFFFESVDGSEAEAFIATSIAQSELTQQEDIAVSESVQRGLNSPTYDAGRYAPRVEHAEYHFHRLLAGDLGGAVGASGAGDAVFSPRRP